MKFRKIAIFGLTIALTGTFCAALAACADKNGYTFEDGAPNADRAAPDEGFRIDGVLDEAAYENISWLEGPVLRPYYTSDGQGVYYDYDVIREQTEKAAQVKMGTYYGENGIYLAYSFREQPGKVCYVNPARRPYRNSGVELHIGIPASETMTGDETVSRLTVNANGALSVAKTQGDLWMPLYGTKDPANMPYVGLTGNGTRTDENADRTEYTFELFLPWGYFDEVGGEGTAQAMKEGGDLVIAPGIVTANNYAGTGQTDREYYVLSARLDDGAWANAQGWYHFGGNGYVGYDINVKEAEHGAVQEWMGYDKAPKNSSLTFVTKAEEGYALKEFRVNGTAVPRDYIRYDMYTSLGAAAEKNVQKAYIRIPKREVTGDLEVEAVFEPLASGTQSLSATVYGAGKVLLPDTKVTFTRGGEILEGVTDGSGKLTIDGMTPGFYDVSVGNIDYRGILDYIFFSTASNSEIVFEENALPLEGSENIASNYKEVYGRVGSVADGFVFSGFFGFEGAEYDELVNFTHTVYFISDKAAGEQFGFRFTKWGGYLMLKCEGVEYHFESDRTALDYFKQQKGVHFAFAVDKEGNIGVYIRRSESEWIRLSANTDIRFPVDREIVAVTFGKQDDGDAKHYAVMDAELTIGTSRLDLPVSVTVNGEQPAAGGNVIEGGRIELPSDIALSDEVTVTLTPERNYAVQSLKVDGLNVECTEANGVYIYTFTASKQSYAIEASFAPAAGDLMIELRLDPSLAGIADDLEVTLSNTSVTWTAVRGEGTVWTAERLPFGRYIVTVSSRSGGYTVLRDSVICEEGDNAVTLTVSPENYGDGRRYELLGENYAETPGVVVGENLGVSKDGFVFDGFLGVGGSGSLTGIGTRNFAAALRFTTESGYQYRICFYIWQGSTWVVKAFEEGRENSEASCEFSITSKLDLLDYVRAQNGISLHLMAAADGTLTVYARTNATDLAYLGEWKSPFPIDEGIKKVEVLKMFQSGIEAWTARVEGVLQYGAPGAEVPVEIAGPENIEGGKIEMPKNVKIGERVTITMEAEEGYDLSVFRVNGTDVAYKGENGSYSYTFTATRTRYEVEAVFGELDDLTISVVTDGVDYQNDIAISLVNARGQQVGIANDGTIFEASRILHGEYYMTVYSTEGYIVMRGTIVFNEQNRDLSVSLTPENYGDSRSYEVSGSTTSESGVTIAEQIGTSEEGFVFEGFLGVGGKGSLAAIGDKNFASGLRFTTESGYQYRIMFYIWGGDYWLVKVFPEGNEGAAHEFPISDKAELMDYVRAHNGVTLTILAETDAATGAGSKLTLYAGTGEDEWMLLGSWDSPFPADEAIERVDVLRMFGGNITGWSAVAEGEFTFKPEEVSFPVTSVVGGETPGYGTVEVEATEIGKEVTVKVTPTDPAYALIGIRVDGELVTPVKDADGYYVYTFTATKSRYDVEAVFAEVYGYTVTVDTTAVPDAADDIAVSLVSETTGESFQATNTNGVWIAQAPYGEYKVVVTAVSGGYTVATQDVVFAEGDTETSVAVNADSYGDDRKYVLNGGSLTETPGTVLVEDIGASEQGFVFQGFLGVGGSSKLSDLGTGNYAAGLRFTMEDGSQFRLMFYIWAGDTWLIKCYDENGENGNNVSADFTQEVRDYVTQRNGVDVTIVIESDGTLAVYAKASDTEWVLLKRGQPKSPFKVTEKIVKVEAVCKFKTNDEGWKATVDGELRFGTTETDIPVTFTGAGESENGEIQVSGANLGEKVTVTVTAKENFIVSGLKVDGTAVTLTEDNGSYIYKFTATKSSYALEAAFEQMHEYTVTVREDGISAGSDLQVVLTNGSMEFVGTQSGSGYTVMAPYGDYTLIVRSVSGGYTVASQQVSFAAGSAETTVTVNADNYGEMRKYELGPHETTANPGSVLAENIGATTEGFVFSGFLGAGDGVDLSVELKGNHFGSILKFTTESDGDYYLGFFIWAKTNFMVRGWTREGNADKNIKEFGFSSDQTVLNYVKEQNGVYMTLVAGVDGTLSAYVKSADDAWVKLGTQSTVFPFAGKIEKIELCNWYSDEGYSAVLKNGLLRFGTTDTDIPVTFTGTGAVENGSIETSSANLGEKVTVTLTPADGYRFKALSVDGTAVTPTAGENGVYTYTFTTTKSSHALAAEFEPIPQGGTLMVNVQIDSSLQNAENDLTITLTDGITSYPATLNTPGTWLVNDLPFGDYTLTVASVSGEYTVLTQAVAFTEGASPVSVSVTPDNYGEMRKYELKGETKSTSGITLAENLGATKDGFVFSGTFGVAEGESLETIGSNNFASVLRLTTESGYRFTFGFYVWQGNWYIRCYNQDAESNRLEFAIQDTAMKAYMTQANAVDVTLVAKTDGTLTVYVKSGAEEWVSLGTQRHTNFKLGEKIDKVEALRVFNIDLTATVNGTLQFGTTEIDFPVTLKGSNSVENPGVVISAALGATKDGYVFTGFLGVGGSGSLKDIGDKNYATALRFTTESGYQYRLTFYIWNGKYWIVKVFQENQENTAASHEFSFTDNTVLIDYVKEKNGLTVSIAASADGTLNVYAMTSETEWISLGEWKSPFKIGERIEKIEVLRMFSNGIEGWTAVVDGELQLGTTETGIPVTNVLTDTINLDEKGTRYWEHYSSGTGGNNGVLATRSSTGSDDGRIQLEFRDMSQGKGDGYETRPDNSDHAQAFTSTNGFYSNGFVFRDGSRPLTATVTIQKDDSSLRVYTGTWIANCQFTITLTDSEGNAIGSAFTVTNGAATYETVFTFDTSSWTEGESRTFTLNMTSNNTLKLMAIAIS